MSKNISNLSGRIGLRDNLFKKMSENVLNDSPKDLKEIAKEYNLGVSTLHGAESFYEFLRPSHREKSFCLQWQCLYVCWHSRKIKR